MVSLEIEAEEAASLALIQESNTYAPIDGIEPITTSNEELRISARSTSTSAAFLQFHLLFPEYPETHTEGVCHMIPIESWDTEKSLLERVKHIQYSTQRVTTRQVNKVEFLRNTSARIIHYRCSGIKICPYLDEDLKKYYHTSVSFTEWPLIRYPFNDHTTLNQTNSQVLSKSFYYFLKNRYQDSRYKCNTLCYQGRMRLVILNKGLYTRYGIGCTNFRGKYNPQRHFWYLIKPTDQTGDLKYLESLFSLQEPSLITHWGCHNVQQRTSSMKACRLHSGMVPEFLKQECNVEFFHIIPTDQITWPYTFTFSRGIHQHAPPPPTKTPQYIISELKEVLQNVNTLQTGLRTFLSSDLLQQFLYDYQVSTLSDLHISLNNHSKLQYLLQRQRILDYPEGTALAGVIFEYNRSHQNPATAYIQEVYHTASQVLIITFSATQAEIFSTCQTLQLDMTFKRVYGSLNELVFATWHHQAQKVCPLARVYMKGEDATTYQLAFQKTFQSLQKYLKTPIFWQHIHGSGIGAITVDMDAAQAKGLGLYLTSIDSQQSWQTHIQKVLIYCLVHFYRGVDLKYRASPYYNAMRSLPSSSKEQVKDLLSTLQADPTTRAWAQHKALPYVLSGLNKYFSLMDATIYDLALKHGNLIESSHWALSRQGIQESLLSAIQRAQRYDCEVAHSCLITQKYNIWSTWNNRTPEKRLQRAALRHTSSTTEIHKTYDIDDFDEPHSPLIKRTIALSNSSNPVAKRPKKALNKEIKVSSSGVPQDGRSKLRRLKSTPNLLKRSTFPVSRKLFVPNSPISDDIEFLFEKPAQLQSLSTSQQSTSQQSTSQQSTSLLPQSGLSRHDLTGYEQEIQILKDAIIAEALKRAKQELSQ